MNAVTRPVNGSWRCTTSNCSLRSRSRIRGFSHIDSETRATEPPLGMGTGLPIGTKPSSSTASTSEQGATIRTSWSQERSCAPRRAMWSFTPPLTA